jgi:hypothetical protein
MNIDAKLEALTQSMELLVSMHRDSEKRTQQMMKRNQRLEQLVTEIAEGTARLLHVVEAHEQRINDLEGNQRQ